VILAHNHPSGNPNPSVEDIKITKKLVNAGKILGIDVLDHIIIGDNEFRSLKQDRIID
jgi:DNA repair protein RadC